MKTIRTQVGILGAAGGTDACATAGAARNRLRHARMHSRQHIEERVRAGVLEQGTVDLLRTLGVAERLDTQGLVHRGIELRFAGRGHRIDLHELTNGRTITIYGQQEVVKDLVAARLAAGGALYFEATDVSLHDLTGSRPRVRFQHNGGDCELSCDFIAGCDGFHGISRRSIPPGVLVEYERTYPFAWLGILAASPPPSSEIIYAYHDRGFALASMRTPQISRLHMQCTPHEDLSKWPNDRIWDELDRRFATEGGTFALKRGSVLQKSIADMRSFVVEPMQYGKLFLAGDAAHIVPPTGAKGLNLAVANVVALARALGDHFATGRREMLDFYSATCLRRVWKVQRFSWWMTSMLHRAETDNAFDHRRRLAELDYVTSSWAASTSLAENYVGLPLDP